MNGRKLMGLAAAAALTTGSLAGCENLPGTRAEQSTVIGGVVGGLAGGALNQSNPLLGVLLGSAIGAGGGYLVGAKTDWFENPDAASDDAQRAISVAQERPATVRDVERSSTADLNSDGFVTVDELVAMERAGLSDDEMLDRMRATDQVYDLSPGQERTLRDAGISDRVIRSMRDINRQEREEILGRRF
jgi:hypothetical protein